MRVVRVIRVVGVIRVMRVIRLIRVVRVTRSYAHARTAFSGRIQAAPPHAAIRRSCINTNKQTYLHTHKHTLIAIITLIIVISPLTLITIIIITS